MCLAEFILNQQDFIKLIMIKVNFEVTYFFWITNNRKVNFKENVV